MQDMPRRIVRLALRVMLTHQPTWLPAMLSNLLQVQTLHVQKSKKAPLGRLSTLVGRAGFEPATN
ncbi:hypothetical protein EM595_2597 [Duffyella gerundensis]|uniref:Uncharacterized protein n=1 Tax=Duffyella gerundensis TaxID=1619313 RepID=A0A0U5LR10_9GAMM|nr:hypothetical protein EM595_2597 [Duffyella gerundensis]